MILSLSLPVPFHTLNRQLPIRGPFFGAVRLTHVLEPKLTRHVAGGGIVGEVADNTMQITARLFSCEV